MPPDPRPFPRFIADNSQEGAPYGRFAERLAEHFRAACAEIEDLPEGAAPPAEIEWYPERAWGGRVWIPGTARGASTDGEIEFFGHVSYVQPSDGEPRDFRAKADFTDVLAEENPDWRIDLNDEVIGRWVGEAGFGSDVTLIWGRPLIPGAVAVTAELEGEAVDQEAFSDRFTLVACDDLAGFGDPVYVEIKLWNRRRELLASETLYEPDADEEGADVEEDSGEPRL
jgi:hypothetical protein